MILHEPSTRALLDQLVEKLASRAPAPAMPLGELLDHVRTRAFGVFLLLSLLPAFLPLPIGAGAVSGPLVCLIGLQLLLQMAHPWLPRALAARPVTAERLSRFRDRTGGWLQKLERLSRPRSEYLIDHGVARAFTGLLLLVLGVLLGLPIPLTNYPFGLILLAFALALIERDGRLMLAAWTLGLFEIAVAAQFSRQITAWVGALLS